MNELHWVDWVIWATGALVWFAIACAVVIIVVAFAWHFFTNLPRAIRFARRVHRHAKTREGYKPVPRHVFIWRSIKAVCNYARSPPTYIWFKDGTQIHWSNEDVHYTGEYPG